MAAPTVDAPEGTREGEPGEELLGAVAHSPLLEGFEPPPPDDDAPAAQEERPPIAYRPLFAAALSTAAAALVTGGIFGTWSARLIALFGGLFGVFWAWLTLRSPGKETTYQATLVPSSLVLALILMIPAGGGGPGEMPKLVRDAIASGRLLRPPVPFDPGWRPILMVVFGLLGYAAVWVGTSMERPRLAIAVPLPVLGLMAMTQPDDGEFVAGLCAFVPLIGALAVLFGGDQVKASELGRDFEMVRAIRGGAAGIAVVVALVLLGNANFLFPEPVYDPSEQPQKPKPIPLSSIEDRVLFEIKTESAITGPWRTGVLDVYDGESWRLPPFDKKRFVDVPADGIVNPTLAPKATEAIQFTIRGLGDATSLPGTATPAKIEKSPDLNAKFDPRADVFRMPEGRVPADVSYTIFMPPYPDAELLKQAPERVGDFKETMEIPSPPGFIKRMLEQAPPSTQWDRLAYVREELRKVAVAVGGGVPQDITPKRVEEIFTSADHEASPFDIVAAEAMLARWVGVPARIGFGFDGVNDENGVMTVRPANAAQWLEVYFEGHGWVPLIEAPQQAKTSFDNEDAKFDPDTVASDEVAVEIYIPLKLESLKLLYERLREKIYTALPFVAVLLAAYLATPSVMKQWRRRKRRKWAEAYGPRTQIAVEYAEFRDLAHDLNVGDPLDTPLEYRRRVVEDSEHEEFAWLVSRAMYGDLAATVTDEDAKAGEELGSSLRRRMFRAQPFQARVLATLSKASLRRPYTDEVPNVVLLDPVGRWTAWRAERRRARRRRRALRGRRRGGLLGVLRVPVTAGRR